MQPAFRLLRICKSSYVLPEILLFLLFQFRRISSGTSHMQLAFQLLRICKSSYVLPEILLFFIIMFNG